MRKRSQDRAGPEPKLLSGAKGVLLVGAALYIVAYLGVALSRLTYPFELEWLEGVTSAHVDRVLAGQPLFVPPSLEFVPLLYPPFYYYVSAAASWLTGPGFTPLRLVSLASSLAILALVFFIVRRETSSNFAAFVAAGLLAATYRLAGAWFDVARVDSLFLALALGGVLAVRATGSSWTGPVLAGFLFALSYLTKQSALLIALPLVAYLLWTRPRAGLWFGATFAGLLGLSILWMNHASDGWYLYYTWTMPRHHALVDGMFLDFWTQDLLRPLPLVMVGCAAYLVYLARQRDKECLFWGALLAGMVGSAWVSRLHTGGYDNVLLPAYTAAVIVFAVGLHRLLEVTRTKVPGREGLFGAAIVGGVILQFAVLIYHPFHQVPTEADRRAGEGLVEELAAMDGTVFIPSAPYLLARAGKATHAHAAMMSDVLRSVDGEAKDMMARALGDSLRERRFDAVVMDTEFPGSCPPRPSSVTDINWFCQDIHDNYRFVRALLPDENVFQPRTGARRRPGNLFLPTEGDRPGIGEP